MRPRTVVIAILVLLLGAFGLRFLVQRFGLLPINQEAVLRHAVAVTVYYQVDGKSKTLRISDAREMNELQAALRIRQNDNHYGYAYGSQAYNAGSGMVVFHFPKGQQQSHTLVGTGQMGEFAVDPAFHTKLCEIVSRHEKQKIDSLVAQPIQQGRGFDKGWGGNPQFDEKVKDGPKDFDGK
jgi:hypothetical protein